MSKFVAIFVASFLLSCDCNAQGFLKKLLKEVGVPAPTGTVKMKSEEKSDEKIIRSEEERAKIKTAKAILKNYYPATEKIQWISSQVDYEKDDTGHTVRLSYKGTPVGDGFDTEQYYDIDGGYKYKTYVEVFNPSKPVGTNQMSGQVISGIGDFKIWTPVNIEDSKWKILHDGKQISGGKVVRLTPVNFEPILGLDKIEIDAAVIPESERVWGDDYAGHRIIAVTAYKQYSKKGLIILENLDAAAYEDEIKKLVDQAEQKSYEIAKVLEGIYKEKAGANTNLNMVISVSSNNFHKVPYFCSWERAGYYLFESLNSSRYPKEKISNLITIPFMDNGNMWKNIEKDRKMPYLPNVASVGYMRADDRKRNTDPEDVAVNTTPLVLNNSPHFFERRNEPTLYLGIHATAYISLVKHWNKLHSENIANQMAQEEANRIKNEKAKVKSAF